MLNAPVPRRLPARAAKSRLFTAHAPRPPARTPSQDPAAHAVPVPPVNAPATEHPLKTRPSPVQLVPVARDLLVAALAKRLPMADTTLPTRSTLPLDDKHMTW